MSSQSDTTQIFFTAAPPRQVGCKPTGPRGGLGARGPVDNYGTRSKPQHPERIRDDDTAADPPEHPEPGFPSWTPIWPHYPETLRLENGHADPVHDVVAGLKVTEHDHIV